MQADYRIGGGWGDSIQWSHPEQFQQGDWDGRLFDVVGWKGNIPRVGQTLMGEFTKSFTKFEFVTVRPCGDPPDMFFAQVKPIEQQLK